MEPKLSTERIRSVGDVESKLLKPLAQKWMERVDAARTDKAAFQSVADQCMKFFSADTRFMWEDKFRKEFMPGMAAPGIQVTIAKAFELVAIFGPTLFWDYPTRQVKSHRGVDPDAVAQMMQQMGLEDQVQEIMAEDEKRKATASVRNSLMQIYLNWSQSQQPANGLAREAQLCITEALVKGRGCSWTQDYQFPGSADTYTGTFYDSVDNLLIDPDCKDPELRTATWIARKHCTPIWEVERTFGLDSGALKSFGTHASSEHAARGNSDETKQNTNDLIEWYEIWSRGGIGSLMRDSDRGLGDAIDKTVGDFCYVCVSREVPYFLNAPPKAIHKAKPTELQEIFAWRTANYGAKWEAWRDGKWPVNLLDFYPVPNSCWPLAPLAPGLGELIALNVLLSAYVEVSWENRKQLIAVMKNAAQSVKTAIQSSNTIEYIELQPQANQTIQQMVQILERPPANRDILDAMAMLSESFDKRTGLSEILYAMSSRQIRVAADANTRQENASIRPEKMARDVAQWMSQVAANEMSMACNLVKSESLTHLLGPMGSMMWKQFVETADSTAMMREMICHIEASDMMRPNRERDLANLQSLAQFMLGPYQQYAQLTGDSAPLNGFLQSIGEAMDHDVSDWEMGPWQQQPDPQQVEMQMQAQQVEMENTQADTILKQSQAAAQMANAESKQSEPLQKQMEFQFEQQAKAAEIRMKQTMAALDMQRKQQESAMKMSQDAEKHQLSMVTQASSHELSSTQEREGHIAGLFQSEESHTQQIQHNEESHKQSLAQQKQLSKLKMELSKQAEPGANNEDS